MMPRRALPALLLGLVILSFVPSFCSAASPRSAGEALYAAGDWDGVVTEYKRDVFLHPSAPGLETSLARIGDAYRNMGEWDRALEYYRKARRAAPVDSVREERRLDAAVVLELRGDAGSAELEYARLAAFGRYPATRERAGVLLSLAQLNGRRWEESESSLDRVHEWTDRARGATLDSLFRAGAGIRRPSPGTARMLSTFVPGFGQAYSGSLAGAAHAFLLNGLFASLFARAALDGRYVEAGVVLLPFLHRYYVGNRETAARAAAEEYGRATEPVVQEIRNAIRSEFAHGP
jgi:tetratricopeptide (TPR) repeat protein